MMGRPKSCAVVLCLHLYNYLLDQQEEECTEGEDVLRAHAQEAEIQSDIERLRNRTREHLLTSN